MWFVRFQILICEPQSFWHKLLVLSWLYLSLLYIITKETKFLTSIFNYPKNSTVENWKKKILRLAKLWDRIRDGNSSENFNPRGIEESRNGNLTFFEDRGRQNLFLRVLGEFWGDFFAHLFLALFCYLLTDQLFL